MIQTHKETTGMCECIKIEHVRAQRAGGRLQTKERGLQRDQLCQHLRLRLLTSRTVRGHISVAEAPRLWDLLEQPWLANIVAWTRYDPFTVLEVRSLRPWCRQGCAPSEGARRACSWPPSELLLVPWLGEAELQSACSALPVCVPVSKFPLLDKDTSQVD